MERENILVVDDDENILELVEYNLSKNGYQVSCVASGEEAIKETRSENPDLVILDLMLPGVDGLEVCRILKNDPRTAHVPILMLTAKGEEADVVTGLEMGADDYVTKPFSPRILLARVKAVLRGRVRKLKQAEEKLSVHDVVIDTGRHEVLVKGKALQLTTSELKLMKMLASAPGRVFTRNQIIDSVHGYDYAVTDRSVDVMVTGLRKKLGEHAKYIETVRGVGYRFKE